LATQLEESGVDVVLDKWDLREGDDKYAFMEKMVTDPAVQKVVVVCDRIYAEKADGREGGVGTETQIISQEIYNQVKPTVQKRKFVALITERDQDGDPYVPTYLKNRIYIDMSAGTASTDAFEQLVRWIYDQPLQKRPERGKPPGYLFGGSSISLGTTSRYQRAADALTQGKFGALGAVTDYYELFADNLEKFRITTIDAGKEYDDQLIYNIDLFVPYRNEAIESFLLIARYYPSEDVVSVLHRFLERVLCYRFRPHEGMASEWSNENFGFICQELFLYAVAAMLKYERFEAVNGLLTSDYFCPDAHTDSGMVPFTLFRRYLRSLEHRNTRLQLRRVSLTSDLLRSRANLSQIPFISLMQSDFVIFLRASVGSRKWWPDTLMYANSLRTPFEVFARAESSRFFAQFRVALGITKKSELAELIDRYRTGKMQIPSWNHDDLEVADLMGLTRIESRP